MVPQTLSEWDLAEVKELLHARVFEADTLEFKQALPHKSADGERCRLRRTCAAFANSYGGFLVFGVADDRTSLPDDRLLGIDQATDFLRYFGEYPRASTPSVDWKAASAPLPLGNGRDLHIIHIERTWREPHAIGNKDEGWDFPKRTNKGNDGMSIEEVRAAFTEPAELRQRVEAFHIAVRYNRDNWQKQRAMLDKEPGSFRVHGTMLRVLEDYLSRPFLRDRIDLDDVAHMWQSARIIQGVIDARIQQQPKDHATRLDATLRGVLDKALPVCERILETIKRIAEEMAGRPAQPVVTYTPFVFDSSHVPSVISTVSLQLDSLAPSPEKPG
jgi:hypothetical protein